MFDAIKEISASLNENEALYISSDPSRIYFTGFHSSAGAVVILKSGAYFFIDFRYIEKARREVKGCEVILMQRFSTQLKEFLAEKKISRLYVETSRMSLDEFAGLKRNLPDTEISDSDEKDKLIYSLRSIKTPGEIKSIEAAQTITDKGFEHILNYIAIGKTERDIALELEFFMRRLGSEGVSFDFIAVSGENSSLPHGVPTDREIRRGDFITLDFGAVVNGYRSDMTRTVAVGEISDEQRLVYNTVLKAQTAAIDYLRAGVRGCDADKVARDIITDAGYGKCFGHSLGHSVGIEVHEAPNCSPNCEEELKSGVIMTVEPGIYIESKFGVRIEDMVLIQNDGIYNFTKSPKELIIL